MTRLGAGGRPRTGVHTPCCTGGALLVHWPALACTGLCEGLRWWKGKKSITGVHCALHSAQHSGALGCTMNALPCAKAEETAMKLRLNGGNALAFLAGRAEKGQVKEQ